MRFTEVLQLDKIRSRFSDVYEYLNNWEQFDPVCPQENIEKINELTEEIYPLIDKVGEILEQLGSINKDSYEY